MRKFLVWTILLSFLLGITGVAMAEKVKLTFWSWRTEDIAAYENFIAEFNKEYPDINIKFIPYKNTEYNTILSTALQGGGGPDIMQLRAYGGLEPLANAGYLVSLEDKVPELEKFSEDVDVISFIPTMPRKASSILVVMPSSISFGEAPG